MLSRGAVGRFDNAAAEAFFSSLEWEVLSLHQFQNPTSHAGCASSWSR